MRDNGILAKQVVDNLHIMFEVNGEFYGLNIMQTESIERMTIITRVPDSSENILGIINLRGDIIPILSLRAKMGLKHYEDTPDLRIIVINTEGYRVGIVVDRVLEIVNVEIDKIQPVKELLTNRDSLLLTGVYEFGYGIVMLIDVDSMLNIEDVT